VVRHRSEDDLKKGGDQEGRAAEQAGLEGAEGKLSLEDRDLAGNHGHGAIIREMVDRVREQDSPGAGHADTKTVGLKLLGLAGNDRRSLTGSEPDENASVHDDPCEKG